MRERNPSQTSRAAVKQSKERKTMATPKDSQREQPSTYFVQDRSNKEEMTRLTLQDQMLTASMGGVLPEQPDPSQFQRILDSGCGTGGWLIEVAKQYPTVSHLVGIDISDRMIEYARAQAEAAHVSDRVEFHTMDSLRQLAFPDGFFDLVNQRLGLSFVRTWNWLSLLNEFGRITRPGGVLRLTEAEMVDSTSTGLARREQLLLQAFHQAGHFFAPEADGITRELVPLLQHYGLQNIQTRIHRLEYRAGTEQGRFFAEDMARGFRTLRPFIQKWAVVPDDYDALFQRTVSEMQQPDFVATWPLLTVWGTFPA
jgi:ubiquinone/menaquinone biosynthesis C-methylase UbiE